MHHKTYHIADLHLLVKLFNHFLLDKFEHTILPQALNSLPSNTMDQVHVEEQHGLATELLPTSSKCTFSQRTIASHLLGQYLHLYLLPLCWSTLCLARSSFLLNTMWHCSHKNTGRCSSWMAMCCFLRGVRYSPVHTLQLDRGLLIVTSSLKLGIRCIYTVLANYLMMRHPQDY